MVSDRNTMILYTTVLNDYYIHINYHCKCENYGINTVHAQKPMQLLQKKKESWLYHSSMSN